MQKQDNPKIILLFSGKRKSGKDYFADKLVELSNTSEVVIIKISAPIKKHFAETFNLRFDELMGSGEYKENFREKMIEWSESMRAKDPGIFCEAAVEMYNGYAKAIWIVSDIRRNTDITWFKDRFGDKVKTVRIEASNEVRMSRGWHFVPGIDDATSECDLDHYKDWDWIFKNDDNNTLNDGIKTVLQFFNSLK